MPIKIDTTKLGLLDRIIPGCKVISIPAGAAPKFVVVELPRADGARISAYYYGFPTIAVNDYVRIQRRGFDNQYDLVGTDRGTASSASGVAPPDAQYVTLATDVTLTNERVLTAGSGLGLTDGGAGSNATLAVDINGLTADATPDSANDYVMTYDASASANKKVLLDNLPGGGGGSGYTAPPTTGWSWLNDTGSDSITSAYSIESMYIAGATNYQIIGRYRALPSTPYTVTMAMFGGPIQTNTMFGLFAYDSGSGYLTTFGYYDSGSSGFYNVYQWTSVSSVSPTNPATKTARVPGVHPLWLQLEDDGTDFTWRWSPDSKNWLDILTQSRTTHLTTPDGIGFWSRRLNKATLPQIMSLVHWVEA